MKPFRSSGQSFNEIPLTDPKKSSFDLSYTNKGSGKIGRLIPVSNKECLPADRISCDLHSLLRFEPLAVPLLSDMKLRHHQYFVPFRQVWSSFESFITGGKDGYSDSHVVPAVKLKQVYQRLQYAFCKLLLDAGYTGNSYDGCGIVIECYNTTARPFDAFFRVDIRTTSKVDETLANFSNLDSCVDSLQAIIEMFFEERLTGVDSRALFNKYYGDDVDLCAFDIWRYNIQHILKKWRASRIMEGLDSSSTAKEVTLRLDSMCQDIYEIMFGSFIGAGSNWDYLGYPVDYIYKNGYNGLTGKSQSGGYGPSPDDPSFVTLNWQLLLPSDVLICSRGVYYPTMIFNDAYYEGRLYLYAKNAFLEEDLQLSVLPLRILYRIWYYNYRDQNLEANVLDPDSVGFKSDSGYDYLLSLLVPRCCAWSKDTFTTATLQAYSTNLVVPVRDSTASSQLEEATIDVPIVDLPDSTSTNATVKMPTHFVQVDNSPLASIKGLTLSNLRKVEALARWLDKNLFIGFQYADQLFSHYNVKYSDARLQIPEYLAGNSEIVRMEVITNNTSTSEQIAGDQVSRAQGLTRSSVDGFFVEEHGLYMAIMSVLPDQSYPFGIDRSLLMTNKFDIAFPEFAQLGSDIVNTGELFTSSYKDFKQNAFTFFKAFGYQGRYYHYKSNFSEQHGELNTSRREYTFARFFEGTPVLDSDFIHCTPNLDMFVSPYADQFVYDILVNLRAQRSLPVYDQVL